jgi:Bardet-Biedl syndrome 1 protein
MLVALTNRQVRVYVDKIHVDTIQLDDVCAAMKFGRFGREDFTLVLITKSGGLHVKILKRTAVFESRSASVGPPAAQQTKMDVPRKTKLFLDQTVRERDSGIEMYRQFQHDLFRIRLETARNYVGVLQKSLTPFSVSQTDPVKLHVEVTGIGPVFRLSMRLQNTSTSQPNVDLSIAFDYDHRLYAVHKPLVAVPMLVPGLEYVFETLIQCLSDRGISDIVRVFVLKKNTTSPLITAVVNMPVSEPIVV